jgi:hypothetical protein
MGYLQFVVRVGLASLDEFLNPLVGHESADLVHVIIGDLRARKCYIERLTSENLFEYG